MKSRTVQSYEELVKACNVDLSLWEPERFRCKSYQVTMRPWATGSTRDGWSRDGDEPLTTQMYSITASFKRKTAVISAREEIDALIKDAKTRITRTPLVKVSPPSSGYLLEVTLPDMHFGRLAWGRETGRENYDLSIAVDTCYAAVENLLSRSSHLRFER